MRYTNSRRWVVCLLAAATLVACDISPEDGRQRGAGLGTGADIDNLPADFAPRSKVFTDTVVDESQDDTSTPGGEDTLNPSPSAQP
jgi:hypothetical protein